MAEGDQDYDVQEEADHRRRVTDQFSYRGRLSPVWSAFDSVMPTEAYLNMGYAPWYVPYPLARPQRRLGHLLGDGLAERMDGTVGRRLLDVGCGRGGPTAAFAARQGFDVTGVDLVRYNLERARETAGKTNRGTGADVGLVQGDATALPLRDGGFQAATAVDSLLYVPAFDRALAAVARVLEPGGWFAMADLVVPRDLDPAGRGAVETFASAWDIASPRSRPELLAALSEADFVVETVRNITDNSTARYGGWARLFLALYDRLPTRITDWVADRWIDLEPVAEATRAAVPALPHLDHLVVFARRREFR